MADVIPWVTMPKYVDLFLEEEHKDHTVNPSLGQKQRLLVIELRKNVWNLNKTRPKVAIVIGEGSIIIELRKSLVPSQCKTKKSGKLSLVKSLLYRNML